MEIDSAEVGPELTEEQHRQALDAESRDVYLMDHLGGDKCFERKHITLNDITELGLHLSPRFDPALREIIDSWLAHSSATSLRPPSLICRGEKRIRAELYRVRDTYKEDARQERHANSEARWAAEREQQKSVARISWKERLFARVVCVNSQSGVKSQRRVRN